MKQLLLSTALVAVTTAPAIAQESNQQSGQMFRQEATQTELQATEFIGMRVYRSDQVDAEAYEGVQDTWEDIGEINDVIFSRDGSVEAVLVDIGGFLGIGENQVAVDMNAIRFVGDSATPDQEQDFFLVLNVPRGALEEAPVYGGMGGAETAATEQAASGTEGSDMTEESAASTDESTGAEEMEAAETAPGAGDAEQTEEQMAETGDAEAQTEENMADAATTEEAEGTGAQGTEMAATTEEAGTTAAEETTATAEQAGSEMGISREGYVSAGAEELTAEELSGAAAYDSNDEKIGEVSELLIAEDGKIKSAVVDVGGFLGLGAKPVELEMSKLDILRSEDGSDVRVYISATEEELEALPEYEG